MGAIVNPNPAAIVLEKQRKGYNKTALTNFDNNNEPQITGNLEVADSLGEFPVVESISGWASVGDGDVYIKIVPDTGAGTIEAEYTDVAPIWNSTRVGWYGTGGSANHRYIFKLTKNGSSGYENKRVMNSSGDSLEVGYRTDQDTRESDSVKFFEIEAVSRLKPPTGVYKFEIVPNGGTFVFPKGFILVSIFGGYPTASGMRLEYYANSSWNPFSRADIDVGSAFPSDGVNVRVNNQSGISKQLDYLLF